MDIVLTQVGKQKRSEEGFADAGIGAGDENNGVQRREYEGERAKREEEFLRETRKEDIPVNLRARRLYGSQKMFGCRGGLRSRGRVSFVRVLRSGYRANLVWTERR